MVFWTSVVGRIWKKQRHGLGALMIAVIVSGEMILVGAQKAHANRNKHELPVDIGLKDTVVIFGR